MSWCWHWLDAPPINGSLFHKQLALLRDRLSPGVEQAAAAPLLAAVGGDHVQARALWGFAHGLVDLELAGRFPPGTNVEAAWAAWLLAFER